MRLFDRQRKQASPAVEISEKKGVRYLHLGGMAIQSAMRIKDPYALELEYTRAMLMFLVLHPVPGDIGLIGLGGGSIAKYIHRYLLECRLEAVEISKEVADAARAYFLLPDNDDRFRVKVGDGADYVSMLHRSLDVLLVDGYDANRIVESLATDAFYLSCLNALRQGGVAVFNLWGSDRFFETYLGRIKAAFEGRVLQLPAEQKGNIQVFGFAPQVGDLSYKILAERARQWDVRLDLGFARFMERLRGYNDMSAYWLLQRGQAADGPPALQVRSRMGQ